MVVNQYTSRVILGVNRGKVVIGNGRATVKFVGGTAPDNLGNHIATQDLNMSGFRIINVGTPTSGTDAVNKNYVDSAISGIDAGDGLGRSGNTIFVGEGLGIKTWPNLTSVDESANFGWSGSHDFRGELLIDSTILQATATEINQALSGIGASVTDTNLTSLTNGSDIGSTLHTHKSKYTTTFNSNSLTITHNLASDIVVQILDSLGNLIEPQTLTIINNNSFSMTFGVTVNGSVTVLRGY